MEFKVTVSVELGPNTFALLSGIMQRAAMPIQETSQTVETATPAAPKADKTETPPAKGGGAGKAPKEEPIRETPKAFEDLDEAEQLEAIKAEVTKHTKRGKSGDIKALLTYFDAGRVSELPTEQYPAFMDALGRYGKGESIDTITSLD
jgi:hypothetical protein